MFARFLFIALAAGSAAGQAGVANLESVRAMIDRREYSAAVAELRSMQQAAPEDFARNDHDYLLARLAERSGDLTTAFASYTEVAGRDTVLRSYALWHLAGIARSFGNPFLERIYLKEMLLRSPDTLLAAASMNRLARSHYAAGDHAIAARYFERLLAGNGVLRSTSFADRLSRENLALLADSYRRIGDLARARELYTRLLDEAPDRKQPDDAALAGARGLDLLDSAAPVTLSSAALQQRAWAYQFNREFENARRLYMTILNTDVSGVYAADAAFQIGRGFTQTGDFTEAVRWYERVLEQYPETPIARDALLHAASSYARLGKYRESAVRYQSFIERFPKEERLDRAYLNLIDIARDQGEEVEALRRAQAAQEAFRGRAAEAQALFAESRIYLAREEWQTAADALIKLESLPDLGGSLVPGGTSIPEVRFLRAVAAENLTRFDEAMSLYLSIPDGRAEFYGMLATRRLQEMAGIEQSRAIIEARLAQTLRAAETAEPNIRRRELQNALRLETDSSKRDSLLDQLRAVYARLPAYTGFDRGLNTAGEQRAAGSAPRIDGNLERHSKAAEKLIALGIYDEAAVELEVAGSVPDMGRLAHFYLLGDNAYRAVQIAETLYRMPDDYQIELIPRAAARSLYPAPYADHAVQHGTIRGVDPHFLLAIMRQESRFRPTARSDAAARGLMQFISTTSSRIADELLLPNFSQDDLYEPSVAIMFGAEYVSELFMLFPGQPEAVAGSYNAGDDNMKRWIGRSHSMSPGRYVPEIMYSQTKDYVRKVMTNYRVYRSLYDEKLFPQ